MKQIITTLVIVCFSLQAFAQFKTIDNTTKREPRNFELAPVTNFLNAEAHPIRSTPIANFTTMPALQLKNPGLQIISDKENGLPIFIKGNLKNLNATKSVDAQAFDFLNEVKSSMQIKNPIDEFQIVNNTTDDLGMQHIKMQQYFNGIEVHGSQVILHKIGQKLDLLNGRYYPTPNIDSVEPALTAAAAESMVRADLPEVKDLSIAETDLLNMDQVTAKLVIYHNDFNIGQEKLAWHITIFSNIIDRWEYFVDANSGEIINKYTHVCKFHNHDLHDHATCNGHHTTEVNESIAIPTVANNFMFGPTTANAIDLHGDNITINTFEQSGDYYLFDGSRNMYNAGQSQVPSDPVGMIVTIDAQNTYPGNSNFNYDVIESGNNSWNNPTAVSAHHNGGLAYKYFEDTFGRNSINGSGGNIISLINVADENGSDMDNAFWNGAAMFYGNGNQAFTSPLPKSLDVAGHEMAHGVVQGTANLEYQGQSGALNESFADIFGAMIDRSNWKIGEDVSNPNIFPNGAIRDMSNPHNGGTQLGDPGWQPDHVNEMYTGSQDNGGVHINSGIPNKAYYLVANAIGKYKAEQIFYRALVNYLTASSQFIDCRNAVLQAAADLHGASSAEQNSVANAFSGVGIGAGASNNYEEDIETNPGEDYILLTDAGLGAIYLASPDGSLTPNGNPLTSSDILSKPSITDDGSAFVFVGADKKLYAISIDWDNGMVDEYAIQEDPIWRNVIIAKDGSRIAALEELYNNGSDNYISVFDFGVSAWSDFELYNPTFTEGISTGDVLFPDAMEFDFNGVEIMYDANNKITGNDGSDIEWWDVSFIQVWNPAANNFTDGLNDISKLYAGLPEGVSVGNATYSKNSPYIIAFDYIDNNEGTVDIVGANLETGATGVIFQNGQLGYPNFSSNDNKVVFDASDSNGDDVLGVVDLQSDKINGVDGTAQVLIPGGKWGVWFSIGERDLMVDTETPFIEMIDFSIFPNPTPNELTIEFAMEDAKDAQIEVIDVFGKQIYNNTLTTNVGRNVVNISLKEFAAGTYIVRLTSGDQMIAQKVVKY